MYYQRKLHDAFAGKSVAARARRAAFDVVAEADAEIALLQAQVAELRSKLNEVHSWIVCAAIASPDDMMQYAQRIEEITRPETACTYPACACDGPAADGGCANPGRPPLT